MRIGTGYDSHRFEAGGPMRLGGVDLPVDFHCAGHSDGDAIAHAVTDAILGAAALGDIGTMFPDNDPVNKNRDSMEMLRLAVTRIHESGWRVGNVDVTVVAQKPRVGPHREAMRERLAAVLRVSTSDVFVKGKTNEQLGWIGREEGLAVMAVAAICSPR